MSPGVGVVYLGVAVQPRLGFRAPFRHASHGSRILHSEAFATRELDLLPDVLAGRAVDVRPARQHHGGVGEDQRGSGVAGTVAVVPAPDGHRAIVHIQRAEIGHQNARVPGVRPKRGLGDLDAGRDDGGAMRSVAFVDDRPPGAPRVLRLQP